MKRLITKADRDEVRAYAFKKLTDKGYQQESFKKLEIFTHETDGKFYLVIFWGNAAKPSHNYYFTSEERRAKMINDVKKSFEEREEWKEKNKGRSSTQALCADAVRAELKTAFPGIKFSVTSDGFAGGDAVRVSWNDGPTTEQVDAITDKYQYGHFDGMQDMYEYSNRRDDIPQTKYMSTSRHMSAETRAVLDAWQAETFTENWNGNESYVLFQKSPLPAGAVVLRVENTGAMTGDLYRIVYQAPEVEQKQEKEKPTYSPVEVKEGEINLVDYSEKAFAVIGDTKSIKDLLKELGGSFNPRLSCGPGWIFSKKRLELVKERLSNRKLLAA